MPPGVKVIFLPANTTRLLQPLDFTVNNGVKSKLRELWVKKHDNSSKKLSRKEIAVRIVEAWESTEEKHIELEFQKAGL